MSIETDKAFAPLDRDDNLERIAGGNETEVYRTDDERFVVKLKHELGGTVVEAVAHAKEMRAAAEEFVDCLGSRHTIPSYYVVARDNEGQAQVLVIQRFLKSAQPLYDVTYDQLSNMDRAEIAAELRHIIQRSLRFYRATGSMPDLYGRTSTSKADRRRLKSPLLLPWRVWSFLFSRNLLRAHNLMLTNDPERRVVLIDYDFVRRGRLYKLIYYTVRWFLFWRDHALIFFMKRGAKVPQGERF